MKCCEDSSTEAQGDDCLDDESTAIVNWEDSDQFVLFPFDIVLSQWITVTRWEGAKFSFCPIVIWLSYF